MESLFVYTPSNTGALRQGEVLSEVHQLTIELTDEQGNSIRKARPLVHPYAVILSQDCDLDWDYNSRSENQTESHYKLLPNVLLCEVAEAAELKQQPGMNSGLFKRIRQNNDPRYQYLEGCPTDLDADKEGFPDLTIDFKRYFTVSAAQLYADLGSLSKRRARLVGPYLGHLCTRFYHFHLRVALPRPHGEASAETTSATT